MIPVTLGKKVMCPSCRKRLPWSLFNMYEPVACPNCAEEIWAFAFPSLFEDRAKESARHPLSADEEASCYNHAQNRASTICDGCGRFLCDLCVISFGSDKVCSSCLEIQRREKKDASKVNSRRLHDELALAMTAYALLLWFLWPLLLIVPPIALYIIFKHWKTPPVRPRTRVRFVIAGLLAVLELTAFAAIILFYLYGIYR